jgi:hypothetical protein
LRVSANGWRGFLEFFTANIRNIPNRHNWPGRDRDKHFQHMFLANSGRLEGLTLSAG